MKKKNNTKKNTKNTGEGLQAFTAQIDSEALFRAVYDGSAAGIVLLDRQGNVIMVNQAIQDLLGYTEKEIIRLGVKRLTHPDDYSDDRRLYEELVSGSRRTYEVEKRLIRKDGKVIWGKIVRSAVPDLTDPGSFIAIGIVEDISSRKKREQQEIFFTRILQMLNEPAGRTDTIKKLLTLIQSYTGLEAVAIRLREGEDYPYYETKGFSDRFVATERYLCERDDVGTLIKDKKGDPILECMCGNIIRGRTDPAKPFFTDQGSFWTNSTSVLLSTTTEKDRQSPTRNRCNLEGYESVALIPVQTGEQCVGLLQLNDRRKGMFTPEMIEFLEGVTSSIGLAFRRKTIDASLRSSARYWGNTFDAMQEVVFLSDLNWNITNCNKATCEFLGKTREQILGSKCWTTIHGAGEHIPNCPMEVMKKTGNRSVQVLHVSDRWLEITVDPLRSPSGDLTGSVHVIADVTEQVSRVEELNQQKKLLDHVFNGVQEGIVIVNENEEIEFSNPAMASLVEDDTGAINKKSFLDFFEESSQAIVLAQTENRRRGETSTYELPLITARGNHKYVRLTCSPRINDDGTYQGAFGALLDITDRKQTEDELRKHRNHLEELVDERTSELVESNRMLTMEIDERKLVEAKLRGSQQRYRILIEAAADPIFSLSRDGEFLSLNQAALNVLGIDPERVPGVGLSEVIPGETANSVMEVLQRVYETGEPVILPDARVPTPQGERIFHGIFTPVRDDTGQIEFVLGICRDITDQRKMEVERQKASKLESIGILAGGIAHDFNNILTAILSNISVAKLHLRPGEKAFDLLSESEKASSRAKNLTQQLLTFAKGGEPVKKTISLKNTLRDTVNFTLSGSNILCKFEIAEDLWMTEVDEGQFTQVFDNLVINAVQAMPEGGTIEVDAQNVLLDGDGGPLNSGRCVRLSVTDHGTGISEAHLQQIFDPYFTTKQKGSGLGLSTCYSIIKRHEGSIQAESTLGVGSTFTIYLPAAEGEEVSVEVSELEDKARSGGHILLMDDDESIKQSIGELLRFLGYDVEVVSDGKEAIECYRAARDSAKPFDVLIMDLTIPGGMGGKEAIHELQCIDPDVKAIVSSGYSTDPVMSNFREHGFSGVVTKPYSIDELNDTIQRILHNGNGNGKGKK